MTNYFKDRCGWSLTKLTASTISNNTFQITLSSTENTGHKSSQATYNNNKHLVVNVQTYKQVYTSSY